MAQDPEEKKQAGDQKLINLLNDNGFDYTTFKELEKAINSGELTYDDCMLLATSELKAALTQDYHVRIVKASQFARLFKS